MFELIENLNLCGVYAIINKISKTSYIGSTKMSFMIRLTHHLGRLRVNLHKNKHLQNAWNKYGEENFIFEIIEITDKYTTLEKEQIWIDKHRELNLKLYNINPLASGTPNLSEEVQKKKSITMKQKHRDGLLKTKFIKGHHPWNKGLTKELQNYDYLKVCKTVTKCVLESRQKRTENNRTIKFPNIYVYDIDYNFLGMWRSAKDLEEFSYTKDNNLPIKSRFSGQERLGVPAKVLQSVNINKACKTGKTYKNLYFYTEKLIS